MLLLELRKTPAQLAKVIERRGIDGYDRFGRKGSFSKDSFEAREALEVLADQVLCQAQSQVDDDDLTGSPAADYRDFSVWDRLGWTKRDLAKVATEVGGTWAVVRKRPMHTQDSGRMDQTNLHIIGALLTMIEGKSNFKAYPELEDRRALVKRIAEVFVDFRGMGHATLPDRLDRGADAVGGWKLTVRSTFATSNKADALRLLPRRKREPTGVSSVNINIRMGTSA